jgi:cyclic beta-1,2-glucan synthetase
VTIARRDGDFETVTEIAVDAESLAESRRVTVTNLSDETATIELTSYQEIVLAPHVSDRGHRAFSNLFVQTEWSPESRSILAMRRPRSAVDTPAWGGHSLASHSMVGSVSCETDRSRFIGRGRSARNPVAMDNPGDLSNNVGAVLDPVLALRVRLVIGAGESQQVIFTTFIAKDRDEAAIKARHYESLQTAAETFQKSANQSVALLSEMQIDAADAARYDDLAARLLYDIVPAIPARFDSDEKQPGRADLLSIGITGEWPILLATLDSRNDLSRVADVLALHRYWRAKGVACDLVILCDAAVRDAESDLNSAIAAENERIDRPRGVFVRWRDALGPREIAILEAVARLRVDCKDGFSKEGANV